MQKSLAFPFLQTTVLCEILGSGYGLLVCFIFLLFLNDLLLYLLRYLHGILFDKNNFISSKMQKNKAIVMVYHDNHEQEENGHEI